MSTRDDLADLLMDALIDRAPTGRLWIHTDDLHPLRKHLADKILAAGWVPAEPLRMLAAEWESEADEDERWLNGPRVSVSEAQSYPATIAVQRVHARDLRAALDAPAVTS